MHGRVSELNRGLRRYDRRLYAKYAGGGVIHICWADANIDRLVFALTDTWTVSGKPVPWGLQPILARLAEIDLSQNGTLFDQMRKRREREQESKERHFKSELEAGLKEQRRAFAKSFEDFNTSICNKTFKGA
jgi:hypothetical protein